MLKFSWKQFKIKLETRSASWTFYVVFATGNEEQCLAAKGIEYPCDQWAIKKAYIVVFCLFVFIWGLLLLLLFF